MCFKKLRSKYIKESEGALSLTYKNSILYVYAEKEEPNCGEKTC